MKTEVVVGKMTRCMKFTLKCSVKQVYLVGLRRGEARMAKRCLIGGGREST